MLFSSTQLKRSKHADLRPPSAAARWTACPGSVQVLPLYDSDESDASIKGDTAHDLLETALLFGILPDTADPDMDINIRTVIEWVRSKAKAYAQFEQCNIYAERQYDIPETGEWGTADITLVTQTVLHIADYKNGYVPVEVNLNEQMMTYLLGAIAVYGERDEYWISVLQPNYNHVDGPFRTMRVSAEQVQTFRTLVLAAVQRTDFQAGKHCKKTYCNHRGSCATFLAWARANGPSEGWHTSEVNSTSDTDLRAALDRSDILHGWRDELRKEAMRRLLHLDRRIDGYKIVKSRSNREFAGEPGREACYAALINIGYNVDDLVERKEFKVGDHTFYEQTALTVAGVERMVKQKYKIFGAGKWKQVWDEYFRPHIREFSGSLTLERATDGRPAHTRGSEFGAIMQPPMRSNQVV